MYENLQRACGVCVCVSVCVLVSQSCPTPRPHGLEPTRLLCPRDSPGKNSGVGCPFLLQQNNELVPDGKRSMSKQYMVTLLI